MSFESLGLIEPLLRALRDEGYQEPTSIQQQAIPHVLEGRDIIGCAQTGTGKTAAFALPILQHLHGTPKALVPRGARVLVLAPTRELAAQIGESFRTYGRYLRIRGAIVYGGVGYGKQISRLRDGVDILVATPGRLLDLVEQRAVRLSGVGILVLDEGDRMLDMGFIHDVRRILREVPRDKQALMFSATMPREIRELAADILDNPAEVSVTPVASTVRTVTQAVYPVAKSDKRSLLLHLVKDETVTRGLVFTRTKSGANRVTEHLEKAGVRAAAIHGNKSQSAREKALAAFKNGSIRLLVATDIAARGIDVDNVSHVINFDIPNEPESYVHRIGRTARAGASGIAWSFCDRDERSFLSAIERTIKMRVGVIEEHPYRSNDNHRSQERTEPSKHGPSNGRSNHSARRHRPRRSGGHYASAR